MVLISFEQLKEILAKRQTGANKALGKSVRTVLEKVRREGDQALYHFTQKFDRVELKNLKVPEKELKKAARALPYRLRKAILVSARRVADYHRKQLPKDFVLQEEGCRIKCCHKPIRKIGLYIPAGQAPLVSTAVMTVVPAKVAGCPEIFVCTPPSCHGKPHPHILGTLYLLGIKNVFAVGGAQAIAALAYGTETIPKVDKIAGPGSVYVNTAKKLLFGEVGIDRLAGPSEVVIFSDETGRPEFIAADLDSQMEHTGGLGIFITTSREMGRLVAEKVKEGYWLLAKNNQAALKIINELAPEHLQIICRKPKELLKKAVASALFLGNYSPTALGDYFAGPSHVLPTDRTSRFSSGLSVHTFLRSYAVIEGTREFLARHGQLIETLADAEGLSSHSHSIALRLKK